MESEPLNDKQERLAATYSGWHFWRTEHGTGALMATRRASISDEEVNEGLARTLPMGVGAGVDLEEQLEQQTRIEESLGRPTRR